MYREFEKKNTLTNQLVGSNLNYNGKYCELGLTAVYNVFNKPLNPEKKYYNIYYPRGKDFIMWEEIINSFGNASLYWVKRL